MSYLLVNDDDGRILAVCESLDEVAAALDEAREEQPQVPLAVVAFHDAPGSIIGTQASVTVRQLD
jgi:hypothetical protein